MVLRLQLSSEVEAALRSKAEAAGVDLSTYALLELERLTKPTMSLQELSGPAAMQFKQSGMTEEQLGELLEQEKHAARLQRRNRPDDQP